MSDKYQIMWWRMKKNYQILGRLGADVVEAMDHYEKTILNVGVQPPSSNYGTLQWAIDLLENGVVEKMENRNFSIMRRPGYMALFDYDRFALHLPLTGWKVKPKTPGYNKIGQEFM